MYVSMYVLVGVYMCMVVSWSWICVCICVYMCVLRGNHKFDSTSIKRRRSDKSRPRLCFFIAALHWVSQRHAVCYYVYVQPVDVQKSGNRDIYSWIQTSRFSLLLKKTDAEGRRSEDIDGTTDTDMGWENVYRCDRGTREWRTKAAGMKIGWEDQNR